MLYLNLLNRIFGKSEGLSREDLENYQSNSSEIDPNEVERASLSDAFDREAFDGWEGHDAKNTMHQLDQRFQKSNGLTTKRKLFITSLSAAAIISSLFIFINYKDTGGSQDIAQNSTPNINKKEYEQVEEKKESTTPVDLSESEISTEIEKAIPKKLEETIDRTEIVELRKGKQEAKSKIKQTEILLDLSELEIKQPKIEETKEVLTFAIKKEIYLYDLKLIDYRPYRSEKMKEERLLMSGTPASEEERSINRTESESPMFEEVDIAYIDYLEKTMYYFSKGMYKKALPRFQQIMKHYPNDVNAHFYGGLCYYNLNKSIEALNYFEKAYNLNYGNFKEEAEWLCYLTYKDMKENKKANVLLQKIAKQGGFYSERAKELISN